jgi:hypothetical protein
MRILNYSRSYLSYIFRLILYSRRVFPKLFVIMDRVNIS